MKGQTFIRVDTIWRILDTHLFKLIRVDAFYTISDPKLFKMYAKIDPKWLMGPQNEVIGGQNASDGAKWTLGAPRCAQREVKVRQDGPKRKPQGAPGDPKRAQDDPKGSPRGAQSEPKRFTRGEGGCPRAPKHETVDCLKSLKNQLFLQQK